MPLVACFKGEIIDPGTSEQICDKEDHLPDETSSHLEAFGENFGVILQAFASKECVNQRLTRFFEAQARQPGPVDALLGPIFEKLSFAV